MTWKRDQTDRAAGHEFVGAADPCVYGDYRSRSAGAELACTLAAADMPEALLTVLREAANTMRALCAWAD